MGIPWSGPRFAVALAAAWGEEFGFGFFFGLGQGEFGGDGDVGRFILGLSCSMAREDQFRYFDWRDFFVCGRGGLLLL